MISGDLRVLLISPLRGLDPPNGDVTYTEELLASPPEGIRYVTYAQALEAGEMEWVGTRSAFTSRHTGLTDSVRALVARRVHRVLSGLRLTFREPPLTVKVTGEFDLVHVHVFNVGFVGAHPPVVASNACPTEVFYRDFERWPRWRLRCAVPVQSALTRLARARLISSSPLIDGRWVLFSEFLVHHYVALGIDPVAISVVPNFLGTPAPTDLDRSPNLIGFCAKDFDGKGGRAVIEAFAEARRANPELRLECVGHETPAELSAEPGVTWLGPVPRAQLTEEVLPRWGAMVYPTRADGVPYAVIEAIAAGCPVVTVPHGAIPEIVPHRVAGFICPTVNPSDLAKGIAYVTDPANQVELSVGARRWFDSHYSADAAQPVLLEAYRSAAALTTVGVAR